jgi:hypothetical protein
MKLLRLALAFALSFVAATSWAQDDAGRAAARQLGKEALAHYEAGELEPALDKFRRAHALVGLTTTGLYTARTLDKLGRLVEASELYLEVSRMGLDADAAPQHVDAKKDAATAYDALQTRIPKLTVVVSNLADGMQADVTLDGLAVPPALVGVARPTDPGAHEVVARAGGATRQASIALKEGASREVMLDFAGVAVPGPAPITPPPPKGVVGPGGPQPGSGESASGESGSVQATLGWVAVGVGGAGLVVGAITGGLAIQKRKDLEDNCPEGACAPEFHGDVDAFGRLRTITSLAIIGGGVLAAAGVVVVLTAPDEPSSQARLVLGPGSVSLSGSF